MSAMTTAGQPEIEGLMAEIARLAPVRKHHLSADMVNGTRQLTVPAALNVISHLNKCQVIAAPVEPAPAASPAIPPRLAAFIGKVPHGYYATPSRTGNNDYDFWRVDDGKDKWAGYAFPVRVLGGGDADSMRTEPLDNMQKRLALQAIVAMGIEKSQLMFAAQIGRCSSCGSPLTDEESRRAGKGPVCRNKTS